MGEPLELERALLDLDLELLAPRARFRRPHPGAVNILLAELHLELRRRDGCRQMDPALSGPGGRRLDRTPLGNQLRDSVLRRGQLDLELPQLARELLGLGIRLRDGIEPHLADPATDHHHEDDEDADDVRDDVEERILTGGGDFFRLGAGHLGGSRDGR